MDIRSLRTALGINQRDFALDANINVHDLSKWERGLAVPDDSAFKILSEKLKVPEDELKRAQRNYNSTVTPGEGYTTVAATDRHIFPPRLQSPDNRIRVLDLFCGCGGFSYGMEQSGYFAVTGGIDLLGDRIETFRNNHPFAACIVGDIREFDKENLKKIAKEPEVIVGGPPCQGYSSIRPFRNLTEGDPRNSLPEEYVLAVHEIRPRWFIFENVVGMLSHAKGASFHSLLESFDALGYAVDWRVINAALLGLPQNRERLIIVGSRDHERFEWPTPTHFSNYRSMAGKKAKRLHADPLFNPSLAPALSVMEAIHDLPEVQAGEGANYYLDDVNPTPYEGLMRGNENELTLHIATGHSEKMLGIIKKSGSNRNALPDGMTTSGFSSCYSRLDAAEPSVTLTVNFVHPSSNKCIHPIQHRALTPREGARLQSFPDNFVFAGKRAQIVKQIGNAVPPLFGRALALALAEAMGTNKAASDQKSTAA